MRHGMCVVASSFRKADKYLDKCTLCETSRYKQFEGDKTNVDDCQGKGKKVAAKQVTYFSLKPRLQKLYIMSKIAKDMK